MAPPTSISAAIPTPIPAPTPVVTAAPDGQPGSTHRDVHQERQETLTNRGPGLAYSRLLRLRTGPLIEQTSILLECDLCQRWELTSDFAYESQLRQGVQWQNLEPVNGRELVASDLEYSYQRMQTLGWANVTMFSQQGITGFKALDEHKLRVNLDFQESDTLLSLADDHSKIVAREVVVERYGNLKDSPVIGTGT
jgi:ABC-type transport system substrate-binding protein